MSGIQVPNQVKKDGAMDLLVKGLQVARDIYGIKEAAAQAEYLEQDRAAKEQERQRMLKREDQQRAGVKTEGEYQDLLLSGNFEAVPEGEKGGTFIKVDGGGESPVLKAIRERQKPKTRPNEYKTSGKDIVEIDPNTGKTRVVHTGKGGGGVGEGGGSKAKPFTYTDEKGNKRLGSIVGTQLSQTPDDPIVEPAKLSDGAKKANATYAERVSGLNAEERKRFDSASMGLNAVDAMTDALKGGSNTFSLVGDNKFTVARTNFEEALGRMQSGGAISGDEERRFRRMAPTVLDSAEVQQQKLAELQAEMALRVQNLGFQPDEVRSARSALASTMKKTPPQESGTAQAAENAKPPPGAIVEVNGKRYQVGQDGDTLIEVK